MKNLKTVSLGGSAKTLALAGVIAASTFATSAFAVGPSAGDLSGLTPDIDTIKTAVTAVGVAIFTIYLAIKGFKIVKGLIR